VTIPANRVTIPAQYVNQTTTPVPLPLPIPNQALELLFLFLSQTLRLYPRRLLQLVEGDLHKLVITKRCTPCSTVCGVGPIFSLPLLQDSLGQLGQPRITNQPKRVDTVRQCCMKVERVPKLDISCQHLKSFVHIVVYRSTTTNQPTILCGQTLLQYLNRSTILTAPRTEFVLSVPP
jgi:hypothetical protein